MSSEAMTGFRCWGAESIGETVFSDIGALSGDADALFLAAHTPVKLEHVKGPETETGISGEAQVLASLINALGDLQNTLIAVTGGSGTGKSHVVRWVHSHLDRADERFHVLYVPRAIQTLRDLLRRIIEGLPDVDGNDLLSRVDEAISTVRPGELQERLVNEIRIALNWTLDDRPPSDGESEEQAAAREDRNAMLGEKNPESGGRDAGLAELIEIPQIKAALLRPDGRLSQLVQSYFDETSTRAETDDIFTPDDLPLKKPGVQKAFGDREELRELWQIIKGQPNDALDLLEEALRVALPKAVGLRSTTGDTLDSLFRESRRAMRAKGQELVLVFEDLAQFGLVDGELYDQFALQPNDDLAPLRVVFAVTDGPYQRMVATVGTRVTHEFRVGGSALADPAAFVGRYLNLTRVGREETQSLWNGRAEDGESATWMANACDTREEGQPCRFRDDCHSAFGSVKIDGLGEVGLYPFNRPSLTRLINKADETAERKGRPTTPRDVVQLAFEEVLVEADQRIADGTYPHERTWQQFETNVQKARDALLTLNPSSDPDRFYRALVIWGNESSLRPGVLEAFDLSSEGVAPAPPEDEDREDDDQPPSPPSTPDLDSPLPPLFQWQNGGSLPENDVTVYRKALHDLVHDRLSLDQHLIHIFNGRGQETLKRIFNVTSFAIEDARGRAADQANSVRFEIKRTPEDVRVLVAARWFVDHGHFDPLRATWRWPNGYDPADLFVDLETRLDEWAGVVRERVLAATGGSRLAQQAIGIRAVALAAGGADESLLREAAGVLRASLSSRTRASSAWQQADDTAVSVVAAVKTEEYIGEFAAVRQGANGLPQLVDPHDLEVAISKFLDDPEGALGDAGDSQDPVIAQQAKLLLKALTACVSDEIVAASEAHKVSKALLEKNSPMSLARRAEEVGTTAKDEGFFRPADKFREFRQAIEVLEASPHTGSHVFSGEDLGAVVRGQGSIREMVVLADALSFIQDVMGQTKEEAERSGTGVGDVSKLETSVKAKLKSLTELVNSLGSGGTK